MFNFAYRSYAVRYGSDFHFRHILGTFLPIKKENPHPTRVEWGGEYPRSEYFSYVSIFTNMP